MAKDVYGVELLRLNLHRSADKNCLPLYFLFRTLGKTWIILFAAVFI
jgi:hypothetical protein